MFFPVSQLINTFPLVIVSGPPILPWHRLHSRLCCFSEKRLLFGKKSMFASREQSDSPWLEQRKSEKNGKEKRRRDEEKAWLDNIQRLLIANDPDILSTKLEKKDILAKAYECLCDYKIREQNLLAENNMRRSFNLLEKTQSLAWQARCEELERENRRLKEELAENEKENRRLMKKNSSPGPSEMSYELSSPDSGLGTPPAKKSCSFPLKANFTPVSSLSMRTIWTPYR